MKTNSLTFSKFFEQREHLLHVDLQETSFITLNNLSFQKYSTRLEIYRRLCIAKSHIEKFFASQLSLKDISLVSSLSENHLMRHFKEAYQLSPHQFIIAKRLSLAEKLLVSTNQPVSTIVLQCGFEDASSFGRLFKRKHRLTPLQYRHARRS